MQGLRSAGISRLRLARRYPPAAVRASAILRQVRNGLVRQNRPADFL